MTSQSKDNGTQSRGFRGGWRRLAIIAVAVAAVFAVASYAWPLFDPHAAQDLCTFGAITNARYLELLRAATPLAGADQSAFEHAIAYGGNIANILQDEFEKLTVGMTSIQERIAAAHAISRAHGAEYLASRPDVVDPFVLYNQSPLTVIVYVYRFNLNKSGLFRPIYPWGEISILYDLNTPKPSYTSLPEFENRFLFTAGASDLLTPHGPSVLRSVVRPDCPPVPTNTWETRYLNSLRGSND